MNLVFKVWLFLLATILLRVGSFWLLNRPPDYQSGTTIIIEGTLNSEPVFDRGYRFPLKGIQILTNTNTSYHFADNIQVNGKITCPAKANTCSHPYISRPEIILRPRTEELGLNRLTNIWLHTAFTVRSHVEKTFHQFLSPTQADLLAGILLGKVAANRQLQNDLATVGLTHVVAASGMNVSLVAIFTLILMSSLTKNKIYKIGGFITIVLFYATLTGFEPPILRAVIMATFILIGSFLGRPSSSVFSLAFAGYLLLLFDPTLLTSASFWLSFTAMMGQIIAGSLTFKLPRCLLPIFDIFLTSFLAIVATLPIVMIFFSRFSLISIVSNLLVLWTIEPLMFLGALAGILGALSKDIVPVLLTPAGVLLDFFLGVVRFLNRPEFLVATPPVGLSFAVGYYLFLGSLYWWWKSRPLHANIR